MIYILLIDDHSIVRTGLKMVIQNLFRASMVEEAANGPEAFEKIKSRHYDLVILDISIPKTDTLQLAADVLSYNRNIKILVCSMNSEEIYAKKYLAAGAMGYIPKHSTDGEVRKAITTVLDNKKYTSEAFREQLVNDPVTGGEGLNPFSRLSSREFEIMRLLLTGVSGLGIGNRLTLHPSTIGTHKARIFKKLHCSDILDVMALATAHNIMVN